MTNGDGRAGDAVVRLALAQIDCDLGDVGANARRVREALAAAPDADLVVFPELALTGYQAGGDAPLPAGHPEIAGLAGDGRAVVVGFGEAAPPDVHNSAAYVEGGAVRHVHRKLNLPTYDIWHERRRFTPGTEIGAFDTAFGRMAILICADAWQPALAALAVRDGARVLVVPAASALRHPDVEETWRDITRFYARTLQCYVVYVNRAGEEPGMRFWGGSHVYGPGGTLLAEAPRDEPALVRVDLDLDVVRRIRTEMPLVDEAGLALRHLALAGGRAAGGGGV
jgi:predicted amidohydrolase